MHTHPVETNAPASEALRPSLADLLAEREPAREARRLLTWICAVSRRPPLDGDLVTAMTARCHAEAVCAAVRTALGARDTLAALRGAEDARRALLHLRAVLYVALGERLLHKVQFDILSRQAGRTQRALDDLAARARSLGAAMAPPPQPARSHHYRPAARRPIVASESDGLGPSGSSAGGHGNPVRVPI
jgi:hypothetical protein